MIDIKYQAKFQNLGYNICKIWHALSFKMLYDKYVKYELRNKGFASVFARILTMQWKDRNKRAKVSLSLKIRTYREDPYQGLNYSIIN